MRPTFTVGAPFRWVSSFAAGGGVAGGFGGPGFQRDRNQASISILRKGVSWGGEVRWRVASETSLGKALGAHEAKGEMRKHRGADL